jgi:DNA recombination protein RmuC
MAMEISMVLIIGAILLVVLLLLGLWSVLQHARGREFLLRFDTRLEEQSRRGELLFAQMTEQIRKTEDIVRSLDKDLREQQVSAHQNVVKELGESRQDQQRVIHELREALVERFGELREGIEQRQGEGLKILHETSQHGWESVQRQVAEALVRNAEEIGKRFELLTQSTDKRLQEISGQVDKRLAEGFEKTTATFADILTRLALIDEAQKKITELSTNVVNLQELLADRSSRGTFGEVQLGALVKNVLPESSFEFQHVLSNGKRVDCMLYLPAPTGNVPVDSKFPLENYRRMADPALSDPERKSAEKEFVRDVRTHISDIAGKYIIPNETADGAVMFVPAEAVFAEIHAHHPDLVEEAQRQRVWITSPTTMMAVLTTARAVLKDAATREQVHIIQRELGKLGEDFGRFQKRMDSLANHIRQAHEDADQVHASARKIASRFNKIEHMELDEIPVQALPAAGSDDLDNDSPEWPQ